MLAKDKLEQLKQAKEQEALDRKILDAISLDLIIKEEVSINAVPKEVKILFVNETTKVAKDDRSKETVYYLGDILFGSVKTVYQVIPVEDFDSYYEEIKNLMNTSKKAKGTGSGIYNFIMVIASIIMLLGIIGGLVMFELSVEIGLAAIISTASFSAILFGIAKIIDLLSKQQK